MSKDIKKSLIIGDIREKEQESYSTYNLDDLIHIILTLMNAYEQDEYSLCGKHEYGNTVIKAVNPTNETKKLVIDTWLMDYLDLQLEYNQEEAINLYGFGPSDSRFKLNLPADNSLDYIQDFADVLYEYRIEHEIRNLSYQELDDLLKKYIEISKDEIEIRKNTKTNIKLIKK